MKKFQSSHPFCDGRFHQLLEDSDLLVKESGWGAFFLEEGDSTLPGYIKGHSDGAYIFDWAWAEFYQKMGVPYYPKMIHALPFTPINAPKVLGSNVDGILQKSKEYYLENEMVSSHHYLFTNQDENQWLSKNDYLLKETLQYHFYNRYTDFEDFLSHLKARKRKKIKKERRAVQEADIETKWVSGDDINSELMSKVFSLYLSTIGKKHSYAYLNKKFFELIPLYLKDDLKLALAYKDEELIAMSLFVVNEKLFE